MGMLIARRRINNNSTPQVEEKVREVKPQPVVKNIPKEPIKEQKKVEVEPTNEGSTQSQIKFKV